MKRIHVQAKALVTGLLILIVWAIATAGAKETTSAKPGDAGNGHWTVDAVQKAIIEIDKRIALSEQEAAQHTAGRSLGRISVRPENTHQPIGTGQNRLPGNDHASGEKKGSAK